MPKTLTPKQLEAIDQPGPILQIMAGAGSGKTEVLAQRAVRLLTSGVDPASIIAITFTEKAAGELKERIELRAAEADPQYRDLPPVGRGMFIGTTHGWDPQNLRDLGGIYETLDGLDDEQEWALLLRVARRLGVVDLFADSGGTKAHKVAVSPAIEVFLRSVDVLYDEGLDARELQSREPEFAQVVERYEWLLEEMRLLPFRSMIRLAARELAPGGRLRQRLDGGVRHVLVDEFQDMNRMQDRLLGYFLELGADLTVVGDDDQAIYQWRGL